MRCDKGYYSKWKEACQESGKRAKLAMVRPPSYISKANLTDAEGEEEDVIMAGQVPAQVHREEVGRKYDPDAVFTLDLNSDSEDE